MTSMGNGNGAAMECDWDDADTDVRVAVLKHRQDRADEDREEMKGHISYVKTQFLPGGAVANVASDVKSIKFLGWFLLVSVPAAVAIIGTLLGGLIWLIRNTSPH